MSFQIKVLVVLAVVLAPLSNACSFNTENGYTFDLGVKHYRLKEYTEAESSFSHSHGYNARVGQALSSYQLKQYKKASSLFKQSILLANDDNERYLSLFNSAVCDFRTADYHSAFLLFTDAERYKNNDFESLKFIKLSKYLSDLVNAQLARDKAKSKKKKSSEGKKTISSVDFVFDENINLRLEDNESTDSKTKNQYSNTISDRELITSLVEAGVSTIKINVDGSNEKLYSIVDKAITYEFSNLEKASYTPPASIPKLWKRIFELEMGFPAGLEESEQVPGIRPW